MKPIKRLKNAFRKRNEIPRPVVYPFDDYVEEQELPSPYDDYYDYEAPP
jgi:hypothetical protein